MSQAPVLEEVIASPQPGPQTAFLASPADIAIYGGSGGAGKTYSLVLESLRHIDIKDFGCVFFRLSYPMITVQGGLWDEVSKLYPSVGGTSNWTNLHWTFPSGSKISFRHLETERDLLEFQGSQIPLLLFDQLEQFSEKVFFYMLSRNRSTCGIAPYIRASANADASSWLARFISWWWDPNTGYAIPERSGVLRWFIRQDDQLIWGDTKEELQAEYPGSLPKSVTFVAGKLSDNQILMKKDPGYLSNLQALPRIERERLLHGNWLIKPSAGKVFNRSWFPIVDVLPSTLPGTTTELLFWDFASTAKQFGKTDPDFTAAVAMRLIGGLIYVTFMDADQIGPAHVERHFETITQQRSSICRMQGIRFVVRWEREPGSASIRETSRYAKLLAGLDARGLPSRGDKIYRAGPLAAQAEAGNVRLLRAPWNEAFLDNLHGFPDLPHDDIADAASSSYSCLVEASERVVRLLASSHQG